VQNALGNNFVVHIADFYYNDEYYETDSAYFADCPETTLITLTSFTATAGNGAVKLEWETASEINNSGFNILRAKTEKGDYRQINEALIPSEGSTTQGASYEFVDNDVRNGKKYFYKLEDIDKNGTSTLHGPVKVKVKKK
jgi:predicted transglutaminase-like cysteine proteinase